MLFFDCAIAQTAPTPATPTELIELFQASHGQLTTSFNVLVGAIGTISVVVGVLLAVVGLRTRQEIQQTLQEIKLSVAEQVRKEVNQQILTRVDAEIGYLEKVVGREAAIGRIQVDYVLLGSDRDHLPPEYKLLKARGFQIAPLVYYPSQAWPDGHVILLDLVTPDPSTERKEALITEIGDQLAAQRCRQAVLVIYVKGRVEAVNALANDVNYITSNMRGTLIGAVVDAAQISQALKNQ